MQPQVKVVTEQLHYWILLINKDNMYSFTEAGICFLGFAIIIHLSKKYVSITHCDSIFIYKFEYDYVYKILNINLTPLYH